MGNVSLCYRPAAGDSRLACEAGRAWDYQTCSGACSECICEVFKCCCRVPTGFYSVGDRTLRCPGGTYQDRIGQSRCRECPGPAEAKYRVVGANRAVAGMSRAGGGEIRSGSGGEIRRRKYGGENTEEYGSILSDDDLVKTQSVVERRKLI